MLKQIKVIQRETRELKTVKELLEYIPQSVVTKVCTSLLVLLVLSPLLRLALSVILLDIRTINYVPHTLNLGMYWYRFMIQIGYISLIFGAIIAGRSINNHVSQGLSLKEYLKKHVLMILLVGFFMWGVIVTAFSSNISLSFFGTTYRKEGLIMYGAYVGYIAVASQVKNSRNIKGIALAFILGSGILALFNVLNSELINNAFTLSQDASVFHNANHYGYFLVLSLMTSLVFLLLYERLDRWFLIVLVTYVLNTLALVINESFGAYLGVIGGIITLIILVIWHHRDQTKKMFSLVALFIAISTYQSVQSNYLTNEVSGVSEGVTNIVARNEEAQSAGSGRWRLWTLGIGYGVERPMTGHGLDNLGYLYTEDNVNNDRPHNEFIQHFASKGLIGLLMYIGLLIGYGIKYLTQGNKDKLINTALMVIVIAYVTSSLFGNTMYYTTPFYLIVLSLGINHLE